VIDTSVCIDMERRFPLRDDLRTLAADESIALTSVTLAELLTGAELGRTQAIRQNIRMTVDVILNHMYLLPFDVDAAQIYARLFAEIRQSGHSVGVIDLQIAAIALANDSSVVMLNLRNFNRIPGLTVVAPAWS
jgi:tRNA(fMet)-specific endonuclease VapC